MAPRPQARAAPPAGLGGRALPVRRRVQSLVRPMSARVELWLPTNAKTKRFILQLVHRAVVSLYLPPPPPRLQLQLHPTPSKRVARTCATNALSKSSVASKTSSAAETSIPQKASASLLRSNASYRTPRAKRICVSPSSAGVPSGNNAPCASCNSRSHHLDPVCRSRIRRVCSPDQHARCSKRRSSHAVKREYQQHKQDTLEI